MDRGAYGRRVIGAVVPRYFPSVAALQVATGMAYSTLNDWANGKADPTFDRLDLVVDAIRRASGVTVDPVDLLRAEGAGAEGALAYGELPGWAAAAAAAATRQVPAWAIELAGKVRGPVLPSAVTPEFVVDLAQLLMRHMPLDHFLDRHVEAVRERRATREPPPAGDARQAKSKGPRK